MKEHCPGKAVARLALVQSRGESGDATPDRRQLEREKAPLDAADFPQRDGQAF